jgi:hypothetical protein
MTAVEMLKAPEAAESIGKICMVITSWACQDRVSKVNTKVNTIRLVMIAMHRAKSARPSGAIVSIPLFIRIISHGLYTADC